MKPFEDPQAFSEENAASPDSETLPASEPLPVAEPVPTVEPPFRVLLHRRDLSPDGSFRPDASFVVTASLRTSGLWAQMSPEDGWTLILLATFLSPEGNVRVSFEQLLEALGVSPSEARKRLERLTSLRFRESPIAVASRTETGAETIALAPTLLRYEADPVPPSPEEALPYVPAGREAVIAHSRELYARPKEEVERTIAEVNGWDAPEAADDGDTPDPDRDAARRLCALGLERAKADDLVARYGAERVMRQVDWLPYRKVRSPVPFLAAAIAGDYERPRDLPTQMQDPDASP